MVDLQRYVMFARVYAPINVDFQVMSIDRDRYIRGRRMSLSVHGPLLANRFIFAADDDGLMTIYAEREFVSRSGNLARLVFITSAQVGIDYRGFGAASFEIQNERVLGYIVLFGDGTFRTWTKPFDLGNNQHLHNFLFRDTVVFFHVRMSVSSYFFTEWQLYVNGTMTTSQSVLFKSGMFRDSYN